MHLALACSLSCWKLELVNPRLNASLFPGPNPLLQNAAVSLSWIISLVFVRAMLYFVTCWNCFYQIHELWNAELSGNQTNFGDEKVSGIIRHIADRWRHLRWRCRWLRVLRGEISMDILTALRTTYIFNHKNELVEKNRSATITSI